MLLGKASAEASAEQAKSKETVRKAKVKLKTSSSWPLLLGAWSHMLATGSPTGTGFLPERARGRLPLRRSTEEGGTSQKAGEAGAKLEEGRGVQAETWGWS
ncbi:hypothetical protein P7K49_035563 [Saguinus oedipus]|uniref:Uncharacterized protein n=1 Tax=Saguinus oedipus TaxID=9490 RepID=A0ABQ9TNX4_SAGOE|nr:hypothetical protein P7K49_035563 [Saguinus oedipus]